MLHAPRATGGLLASASPRVRCAGTALATLLHQMKQFHGARGPIARGISSRHRHIGEPRSRRGLCALRFDVTRSVGETRAAASNRRITSAARAPPRYRTHLAIGADFPASTPA